MISKNTAFQDLIPDIDINKLTGNMIKVGEKIKGTANEIDLDPALKKVIDFRQVHFYKFFMNGLYFHLTF